MNVAVKFCAIYGLASEGYYKIKICAGTNDLQSTELVLQPMLEAFAFDAIMRLDSEKD